MFHDVHGYTLALRYVVGTYYMLMQSCYDLDCTIALSSASILPCIVTPRAAVHARSATLRH
jgi:hypothetical protein